MGRLRPYLELLHLAPIVAVLVAAASFTVAAARGAPSLERLLPFLTALLLTQVSISLHNDYCDRELDAGTKPWRAIPSGRLRAVTALRVAIALFALGLLVAAPLGPAVVALVAGGTALGFLYNAGLKASAWSWLPFWLALPTLAVCAALVAGRFEPRLALAYLIGAPIAVAIHLADTLADIESDVARGVRGLAHRLGRRRALLASWGLLGLGLALALPLWPASRAPGPLYLAALALFGAAILAGTSSVGRLHWGLLTAAAIAAGLDWLAATLS